MNSINDVWNMVLDKLKNELSKTTIDTWFDEITPVSMEDDSFLVLCPNDFKRSTIASRYLPIIQACLEDLFSTPFTVKLLSEQDLEERGLREVDSDKKPSYLTSKQTFSNFIVGPSNKMAFAAAQNVAENPSKNYNPLFIYGDSGLGKTHLIQAIAHEISEKFPDYKIIYIKGDEFTNELVKSIRYGTTEDFRNKYRTCDLLMIDDVQFIAGKPQTEEEVFHTFDTLHQAQKQIVLVSDRPPREMTLLEDRLKTRFEWGLMVDIQPPDFETRIAIVKNKIAQKGILLPDNIIKYIAENVTANVRQLEGTINKIIAYKDLLGKDFDEEAINKAISDILMKDNDYMPTVGTIISYVSKYYSLDEKTIRGQSRKKEIVLARGVAIYLARKMTNLSFADIGKQFSNRDHTSIMYTIKSVEKEMKKDIKYAESIKDIESNIHS